MRQFIIKLALLVALTLVVGATVGCTHTPNSDPYGYDSSLGISESENLANDLDALKQELGPSHPAYQRVVSLAEQANRHRDRMRRLKVYIVTLRAILDQ